MGVGGASRDAARHERHVTCAQNRTEVKRAMQNGSATACEDAGFQVTRKGVRPQPARGRSVYPVRHYAGSNSRPGRNLRWGGHPEQQLKPSPFAPRRLQSVTRELSSLIRHPESAGLRLSLPEAVLTELLSRTLPAAKPYIYFLM